MKKEYRLNLFRRNMRFSALAILLVLGGCVGVDQSNPSAVQTSTVAKFNPNMGKFEYSSQPSGINGNILQGVYLLRGTRDKGAPINQTFHQVYVSVTASNWLFLDEAYSNGSNLRFAAIDREVLSCGSYGCNISEVFGINITYAELEGYASTGLTMQVNGQRGNRVITIPGSYFRGYLDAVNASA